MSCSKKFIIKFDAILQKEYLLGDSISYLDFALIPHILQIYAFELLVFPFSMLTKHQNLSNWLNLMMTRNSVKSTSQNHARFFIEHLQHRGFFTQFVTK